MELLLLGHLVLTSFLCGLIWVVQLVHYPLFVYVERARFAAFEAQHQRRISWIVGPAMLLELGTGLLVLVAAWRGPHVHLLPLAALNASLLMTIWAATAWLSVPQHRRLARGFDDQAWGRLVRSNWARTVAWSARLMIVALAVAGS